MGFVGCCSRGSQSPTLIRWLAFLVIPRLLQWVRQFGFAALVRIALVVRLLWTGLQRCWGTKFVLLVAETGLPQCSHYRIEHKRQLFASSGYRVVVFSWGQAVWLHPFLCFFSLLILYRVPASLKVSRLITHARHCSIPVAWEVDDLIFDTVALRTFHGLESVKPAIRESVITGSAAYCDALSLADYGIASTPFLARAMEVAGKLPVFVLENGIDHATLEFARSLRMQARRMSRLPGKLDDAVRVVYGSGTDTHDHDLALVAPALDQLMDSYPGVMLRLVGPLQLPTCLDRHQSRIERFGLVPFRPYLRLLSECQISLCPLLPTRFNEAKSCIKYLEASLLGIPSICSPRSSFRSLIRHGYNGFLCTDSEEWLQCLILLLTDGDLRLSIGLQALADVTDRFDLSSLAVQQLRPLLVAASLPIS